VPAARGAVLGAAQVEDYKNVERYGLERRAEGGSDGNDIGKRLLPPRHHLSSRSCAPLSPTVSRTAELTWFVFALDNFKYCLAPFTACHRLSRICGGK
jgi:hypothetical protein